MGFVLDVTKVFFVHSEAPVLANSYTTSQIKKLYGGGGNYNRVLVELATLLVEEEEGKKKYNKRAQWLGYLKS